MERLGLVCHMNLGYMGPSKCLQLSRREPNPTCAFDRIRYQSWREFLLTDKTFIVCIMSGMLISMFVWLSISPPFYMVFVCFERGLLVWWCWFVHISTHFSYLLFLWLGWNTLSSPINILAIKNNCSPSH